MNTLDTAALQQRAVSDYLDTLAQQHERLPLSAAVSATEMQDHEQETH